MVYMLRAMNLLLVLQLSGLFIQDERPIQYSAAFLRRMVTAKPMMSVCYLMIIQFQAMRKVKESLITAGMFYRKKPAKQPPAVD